MQNSQQQSPASILDALGITQPSQISIEIIAQFCGAIVNYEPLDGCDAYLVGLEKRAIIAVNNKTNPARQRFSIAHELGHWMLDRGKISGGCNPNSETRDWNDNSPETRADQFAQELLMPEKMFRPLFTERPITFTTAKALAAEFKVSLTAAARRLVELSPVPSMLICHRKEKRWWFARSRRIPSSVWPHIQLSEETVAAKILAKTPVANTSQMITGDKWIDHKNARRAEVHEDSTKGYGDTVLTLLWWKDDQQLKLFL